MAEFDMNELKPNSHKYRNEESEKSTERQHLKPVVGKDSIVTTKKSFGKKVGELFLSESGRDIKEYVIKDLIIPGIMNAVIDTLKMAFFGERDNRRYERGRTYGEPYSYSSRYRYDRPDRSSRREDNRYRADDKVDYRNIVLNTREDADRIVYELRDRIHETGQATVADLFDLVGVAGNYTDNHWGWKDERDLRVRRVSNGYLIDVAEAIYVD